MSNLLTNSENSLLIYFFRLFFFNFQYIDFTTSSHLYICVHSNLTDPKRFLVLPSNGFPIEMDQKFNLQEYGEPWQFNSSCTTASFCFH